MLRHLNIYVFEICGNIKRPTYSRQKNEQTYKTTEHLMIPLVITIFLSVCFFTGFPAEKHNFDF